MFLKRLTIAAGLLLAAALGWLVLAPDVAEPDADSNIPGDHVQGS